VWTIVAELSGGRSFVEFEKEFFRSVAPSSLLKARFATTDQVAGVLSARATKARRTRSV